MIHLNQIRFFEDSKPFSFEFPKSGICALIGPNGSGKTTLINAIIGYHPILQGTIKINGEEGLESVSRYCALVPQEHEYPGEYNIESFLKIGIESDPKEKLSYTQRLKLEPLLDRRLDTLSTGERQRVFLAHALLRKTPIVLLDEPTNHLDPGGVQEFWEILTGLAADRLFIVSTHDLEMLKKQDSLVCAMKERTLWNSGPLAQISLSELYLT